MLDNYIICYLIAFILGWFLSRHMGDGFSVGAQEGCTYNSDFLTSDYFVKDTKYYVDDLATVCNLSGPMDTDNDSSHLSDAEKSKCDKTEPKNPKPPPDTPKMCKVLNCDIEKNKKLIEDLNKYCCANLGKNVNGWDDLECKNMDDYGDFCNKKCADVLMPYLDSCPNKDEIKEKFINETISNHKVQIDNLVKSCHKRQKKNLDDVRKNIPPPPPPQSCSDFSTESTCPSDKCWWSGKCNESPKYNPSAYPRNRLNCPGKTKFTGIDEYKRQNYGINRQWVCRPNMVEHCNDITESSYKKEKARDPSVARKYSQDKYPYGGPMSGKYKSAKEKCNDSYQGNKIGHGRKCQWLENGLILELGKNRCNPGDKKCGEPICTPKLRGSVGSDKKHRHGPHKDIERGIFQECLLGGCGDKCTQGECDNNDEHAPEELLQKINPNYHRPPPDQWVIDNPQGWGDLESKWKITHRAHRALMNARKSLPGSGARTRSETCPLDEWTLWEPECH